MDYPEEKIRTAIRLVMGLLVQGAYGALADISSPARNRLDPEDIARTIADYPGKLRLPAETELLYDVVEIQDSRPRRFSVDAPVFTIEEGRSDLTLRMVVTEQEGDGFEVEFYDVWVM